MTAIGVHIGRIDEMDSIGEGDQVESISTLDDSFELQAELLRELSLRIAQFLGIMPPKSYPNVQSIIYVNNTLQVAYTAHAHLAGVKNCG